MPQKTNLNISPYFDDFDKNDNFYKVLFKPGFPVQARELTSLQSILQNQVESFGSHMFKEGSMVIPGGITFDDEYYSIKLNSEHLGIPISLYIDKLVGLRLTGQNSGVKIVVDKYLQPSDSTEIDDTTIFVKYVSSGDNNDASGLIDGEALLTDSVFSYGNTVFNEGDSVLTLISEGASAVGSAAAISDGVYFIRGTFVDVSADKIVLDPYSNTPSYRIGLSIQEELISAKDDDSLYDNARGFTNFAAPGSDRLKIGLVLVKKSISDTSDKTFVELLRLDEGEIKVLNNKPQYNLIRDYFAKRTFEESGNYSVEGFKVQVANSLNDGISNEGVFTSSQTTDQGNTPTDDIMAVKVSSGKAYVRGYDIDKGVTTILDVQKPRDKEKVESSLIPLALGNKIKVNNVQGTPFIGINNNHTIQLSNSRLGSGTISSASGTVIGEARVYSFGLSDAAYKNDASTWDLYLFDVQTYTQITTNLALSNAELPATSYVEGISSGAFGYAVSAGGDSATHMLVQTSGTFMKGEALRINGSTEIPRSIKEVKVFGTQDIKSVYQNTGGSGGILATTTVDFAADTVLSRIIPKGFTVADQLVINASGIASCAGRNFLGIKSDTIIRYQRPNSDEVFNKVRHIPADGLTMDLDAVETVSGVCNGAIPATGQETVTFSIGRPSITNNEDSGLFAPLPAENISDINLSESTLVVSKQLTGKSTGAAGTFSLNVSDTGISSSFFENFDEERYSIHYADGQIEDLTSDQFTLSTNGTKVDFKGLRSGQNNVVVNSTVRKKDIVSKQKDLVRSEKITIDKTVSVASTAPGALTQNNFYGLRVEDKEISLNVPDVINIVGVFESLDTSLPSFDKLTFIAGLNLDTASILGEKIIGAESGAIAQLTERSSATEVEIVYLTQTKFIPGESVTFEESNIITNLQAITLGVHLDISDRYTLDKGHKEQYLDYSKIVRVAGLPKPTRKVTVIYNRYNVPDSDNGDIFTVASYDDRRFLKDIPILNNDVRASDTLDFRPRVSSVSGITTASPFAFSMRNFGVTGTNPSLVVAPEESSILGYSFYLPRIDKVVLDSLENLSVVKGVSSIDPKEPLNVEAAMTIATIELPPYLYDPDDAKVIMVDNKRFTMRDIGKLEDRIENLETITSLSLLELDTKTLQIQDADGLSRFKTGFFVDDFKNNNLLDIKNPDCKCDVNTGTKELVSPLDFYSIKPEIAVSTTLNVDEIDLSSDLELLDNNIRKTGDIVTLNYDEVTLLDQPLASRTENVNPFNMVKFEGIITLNPASDNWTRNVTISGGDRTITGDTAGTFVNQVKSGSRPDTHIRSRNVAFTANGLQPFTRYYPFFDSTSGIDVIPKLIEITMVSGSFQSGETVISGGDEVTLRICQPNHKTGDINNPSNTFSNNPYNKSITLPTGYSASTTVLNVDIAALAEEAQGRFSGRISKGMTLLGQRSGAVATVSDIRIITDRFGDVFGSFFFRDPLSVPTPVLRFQNGSSSFKLTSSPTNSEGLPGDPAVSSAETVYRTSGVVDEFTTSTVTIRIPPPPVINITNITNIDITQNITNITNVFNIRRRSGGRRNDPLAQTFTTDETGCLLSSVDIFLAKKDENEKLQVQIRTTELGTPTLTLVQDYAQVSLEPSEINVSDDASVPTTVTFPSPIYLEPNQSFAVVLLAPTTNNYLAWIARMGEATVDTQSLPNTESVIITNQYIGGSLFRSQNGSIWTANQFEDMKIRLKKCNFLSNLGTLYLYNPKLGNRNAQTQRLLPNTITTLPRKLRVIIDGTNNANLVVGRKVSEGATSGPTGIIEKIGSPLNSLSTTNVGVGYSNGSFSGVPLYNITGNGELATATVVISNNVVSSVSVTGVGTGYVKGDVLGITTANVSKGRGAQLTVSAVTADKDVLYLTDVVGETFTTGGDVYYFANNGARTVVDAGNVRVRGQSVISPLNEGNVFEVQHYSHGMKADNNKVQISDIQPDTVPVKLIDNMTISSTTINVGAANTSYFANYEGISTASAGYAKIGQEIIYYSSVDADGNLGIGTRGIDNTVAQPHSVDDLVYKYELNGISLIGINTTHDMTAELNAYQDIDKFYLSAGRGVRQTDDTQLSFTNQKTTGGTNIFVSKNFQYNAILPRFNVLTPGETTGLSAQLRSVSGTSAGGSEISFIDQGYENIEIGQLNKLSSTRLICSEVNELEHLNNLPKNRSTTFAVQFTSQDPNLSPMLDLQNGTFILQRNKFNKPVSDYSNDSRANEISGDPHASIYISNRIDLKQPASSLKVLVSAFRHSSADFRVLYQLFRPDSSEVEQTYELFPGYNNLTDTDDDGFGDTIIDVSLNNGRSDAFVTSSKNDEFKEYQFSIDDLESFTGFKIKIVSSGTNEAESTRFKDLRVIALA